MSTFSEVWGVKHTLTPPPLFWECLVCAGLTIVVYSQWTMFGFLPKSSNVPKVLLYVLVLTTLPDYNLVFQAEDLVIPTEKKAIKHLLCWYLAFQEWFFVTLGAKFPRDFWRSGVDLNSPITSGFCDGQPGSRQPVVAFFWVWEYHQKGCSICFRLTWPYLNWCYSWDSILFIIFCFIFDCFTQRIIKYIFYFNDFLNHSNSSLMLTETYRTPTAKEKQARKG